MLLLRYLTVDVSNISTRLGMLRKDDPKALSLLSTNICFRRILIEV